VLLQFSGFYLPACLMPPLVNIPYYISFGKFAFEGLLQNEFGQAPEVRDTTTIFISFFCKSLMSYNSHHKSSAAQPKKTVPAPKR